MKTHTFTGNGTWTVPMPNDRPENLQLLFDGTATGDIQVWTIENNHRVRVNNTHAVLEALDDTGVVRSQIRFWCKGVVQVEHFNHGGGDLKVTMS